MHTGIPLDCTYEHTNTGITTPHGLEALKICMTVQLLLATNNSETSQNAITFIVKKKKKKEKSRDFSTGEVEIKMY